MVDKKTLAGLELFEGLPDQALEAIAAIAEKKRYAPGEIIFSPERSAEWAFLLSEGLGPPDGPRLHPARAGRRSASLETPGQAFGFSSVVGQGHHNSSAEAVTEVEAVAIDGPRFLDYLEKDPEVGFTVMRRVARAISRRLATLRRHAARDHHRLREAGQHDA